MYKDQLTQISASSQDIDGQLATRLLAIIDSFNAGQIESGIAKRKMRKIGYAFSNLEFDNKEAILNTIKFALAKDADLTLL